MMETHDPETAGLLGELDELRTRFDAWANLTSGLGTAADDRALGTFLCPRGFLPKTVLEEFYKQNPIAKRIVNRPSDDSTRVPFRIEDLDVEIDTKQMMSDMEDLGLLSWLNLGTKWARLYGGALGFVATKEFRDERNDNRNLMSRLNPERVRDIVGLHVVDRFNARPRGTRFKLNKAGFLIPEWYEVTLPNGKVKVVHKSRTVRFDGVAIPPDMLVQNDYWGLSELESVYDDLRRLYVTRQNLENFVHEASVVVMKIEGLKKMLTTKRPDGKDPKKVVAEALQNLRRQATNFHWLGIDSTDDYSIQTKPTSGLENVEKSFVDAVVMSDDIPRSILLGETPGGLNTGENAGEIRSYYDWISVKRDQEHTPKIGFVLDLYFQAAHNRNRIASQTDPGVVDYPVPENYTITWESLWQQDDEGLVAQTKAESDVDKAYIDMGVLTVEEVRRKRFVEGIRGPLQLEDGDASDGSSLSTVSEFAAIIEKVTVGLIPGESAIELLLLAQPGLTRERAEQIVKPASEMGSVASQIAAEEAANEEAESTIDPSFESEENLEPPPIADPADFVDVPNDLMSAKEIGTRLGVSASTIRGMGKRGEIRYWKVGSQLRYSLSEAIEASDPGGDFQIAPPGSVKAPEPEMPIVSEVAVMVPTVEDEEIREVPKAGEEIEKIPAVEDEEVRAVPRVTDF